MTDDKNCKITLYLDTPKMLLRPNLDTTYGTKSGIEDSTWFSGHAFIGITDKDGNEERWGYGPVPDQADWKYITGCPSYFKREDDTHYNEAIVFPVTEKQYGSAKARIEALKRVNPEYKLFSRNCSTVAASILKASGVYAPKGVIRFCPHTLVLKKRAMLARMKAALMLKKAERKLAKLFGVAPAPEVPLLEALRGKPVPVSIKEGMKASKNKTPLTDREIMRSLLPRQAKGY